MNLTAWVIIAGFAFIATLFYVRLFINMQKMKHKICEVNVMRESQNEQLKEYKDRYEVIFEQAVNPSAIISLDGRTLEANALFCELFGYNKAEMLAANFYFLIHPTDVSHFQINIQHLLDKKINLYKTEEQCYRKNGEKVWVTLSLAIVRRDDKPLYFIVQLVDLSWKKHVEEEVNLQVADDTVTNLPKLNKFKPFIEYLIAHAKRHQEVYGVLLLDLDDFKRINNQLGIAAGDAILKIVAERLTSNVRSTDMVSRLTEDEFVIIATDIKDAESCAYVAKKLLDTMGKPVMMHGKEVNLTASIGVSTYPEDAKDLPSLLKNADSALYRAKEKGGNQYQFFRDNITKKSKQKIALQDALSQAFYAQEFSLYYQPKMNLKTRRITGVEALLRWQNPEFGTVPTNKIIALAEETGLIASVTDWILKTSCQQLKNWHNMGFKTLTMAINFSSRPFIQQDFIKDILDLIERSGVSPSSFEIEISEKSIINMTEDTLKILQELNKEGIPITLDNFGSNYWSLHHLKDIVSKIKITKSYIKRCPFDDVSAATIRSIVEMAKNLNLVTIAEGVEVKEQYQFVAEVGCTEMQGYYLSPPIPVKEMTEFLKHPIPDAEVISKDLVTE